ncbi:SMP-30/gluconolactonase/LRE family protein, partial [Microvirga calopogonii]|uniref:SMP-30/gluconolactonase/LRE family protein n=1 Tax=Microvirga calopogonii TaxID=2078013 RepID=UPI0013B3B197
MFRDVAVVLDERFQHLFKGSARLEKLAEGCRWSEGPAYFPAGRYVVWSDIPNDRMMRFDETSGTVSVFRHPAGYSNGNTVDRQGRLVTCEHGNRRVTRTEHDGSITVLASQYQGKRLNSPNDVVVKSDGSIWFTDPAYGIDSDYEGHKAESEIGACHVYRIDPQTGDVRIVGDDFVRPNGIAFSPDETRLYVADTGATHVKDGPRHIRVFDVSADGSLSGGKVFATCTAGLFDGFRLDDAGRIWT